MTINTGYFNGLGAQSTATNSALTALVSNTDPTKIPVLAAQLQAESAALESMKKAMDDAIKAMAGK